MDFQHVIVHKGTDYHSAFPEVTGLQNGDLVAVFRQAPVRPGSGVHGEPDARVSHFHEDTGSRIALVRSKDDGLTWDQSSFVVVDPVDTTQDRNVAMVAQASSGELIVNGMRISAHVDKARAAKLATEKQTRPELAECPIGVTAFDSVYLVRSKDNGRTWGKAKPFGVPSMSYWTHTGMTGVVELPDGTWLLMLHGHAASDSKERAFLVRSRDEGKTWRQASTVAYDPEQRVGFHEPPLLRLSSGRLITVIRTDGGDGYQYQAYSDDDGWTWQGLKRTPMWGQPCNVIELRSGRVLCTYGYRREPFGVRAAFSEDQGETWDMGHEVVIRDDGIHRDLGYPASVEMKDGRILSVYYFHGQDGIRFIGGSIWSEEDALR